MITGIHHLSMKCGTQAEYEKAKSFYLEVLGFSVVREWPEGIMIDTGCGQIEIFCNGEGIRSKGAIRHVAFATDDVDGAAEKVRAAGYRVFIEPNDLVIHSDPEFCARMAFCIGPLGEEIEFYGEKGSFPCKGDRAEKPQMQPADTLSGEHIVLRKAREEDWKSMLENVWGNEAVYRWMLFQPTFTEEDAKERCRRSIQYQKDHYAWFVALKETDEAVGLCALRENEPGRFEEAGICIAPKCQGKGYGKEIVSLLLDLAFRKLGAADLRYGYFRENEKSRKVAEHFGFRYDRSEEMVRPWDGSLKKIDSCLLTREAYLAQLRGKNPE